MPGTPSGTTRENPSPLLSTASAATPVLDELLLWQLADSAFPAGGFAHSGGLEAAFHLGDVRTRNDLPGFLTESLYQQASASLPFLLAALREPERFAEWDAEVEAFLTNHVANRASRLQGRAFRIAVERSFQWDSVAAEFGHLAPTLGWVLGRMGIAEVSAARLFLFLQLRGWVGAAIRLGIVGPLEGQGIQRQLGATLEAARLVGMELRPEQAFQTAPLLELSQTQHDRLYSRLFQS